MMTSREDKFPKLMMILNLTL